MKKRFAKTAVYLLMFSWMVLPCAALAQPAAEGPVSEEMAVSDINKELGLTAKQKEQLKEQRYEMQLARMELRNKVKLKELQLRHELEKQQVNRESVNKIVNELKDLQGALLEQRVNSILRMREIFTPEQLEKLHSLTAERMQKRSQGQGNSFSERIRERFRGMGNRFRNRNKQ